MNVGVSMNSVRHTDAISLLTSFDGGSVPLIVADPPYGIAYHFNSEFSNLIGEVNKKDKP
jgi:DNA modification methylase